MSHKGIRTLIQDAAKSLGDDIDFTYARVSDFNVTSSDKRYPYVVLDLLTAVPTYTVNNTSNFTKTWQAQIVFCSLDNAGSTQDEYAQILDFSDLLLDRFINKLNFYTESSAINSDQILITSMSQQPFIKDFSAILTGYMLTCRIQVTDQFNYCGLGC